MKNKPETISLTVPSFLVFTVFLTLKVAGVIDWSWWIVTLPLWFSFAFIMGFFIFWVGALLLWGVFTMFMASAAIAYDKLRNKK